MLGRRNAFGWTKATIVNPRKWNFGILLSRVAGYLIKYSRHLVLNLFSLLRTPPPQLANKRKLHQDLEETKCVYFDTEMLLPAMPAVTQMGWVFITLVNLTPSWWLWKMQPCSLIARFLFFHSQLEYNRETKGNKREMDPERTWRMATKQTKKVIMNPRHRAGPMCHPRPLSQGE